MQSVVIFLIATFCATRFTQAFTLTSTFPYLPDFVTSLGVSEYNVARYIGVIAATFACSEALFAVPWSFLSNLLGRKLILLITLLMLAPAYINIGFSKSIAQALLCTAVTGAANGNLGVLRTMVAELTPAKEDQARSFSYLLISGTIGSVTGPIVGGFLATVVQPHAGTLIPSSVFRRYPYLLPNIVETSREIRYTIFRAYDQLRPKPPEINTLDDEARLDHMALLDDSVGDNGRQLTSDPYPNGGPGIQVHESPYSEAKPSQRDRILANPYVWVNAILGFHSTGFDNIIPVFMHSPPKEDTDPGKTPFVEFGGGLGKSELY
ncbi:major facilitator superfamily domain-containing protein [Xylogone sp. PMI_703]|nr:major facilitator superfamily domain-containing protein [Xylogone sp. PMI_703]